MTESTTLADINRERRRKVREAEQRRMEALSEQHGRFQKLAREASAVAAAAAPNAKPAKVKKAKRKNWSNYNIMTGQKLTKEERAEARARVDKILADMDDVVEAEERAKRDGPYFPRAITGAAPELRSSDVRVTGLQEPLIYGEGSSYSWIRDVITDARERYSPGATLLSRAHPENSPAAVQDRLLRHQQQMSHIAKTGTDAQRAGLRSWFEEQARTATPSEAAEQRRKADWRKFLEVRDVSTAAESMGTMAPPIFLLERFETWNSPYCTAASAVRRVLLPASGMQVLVPRATARQGAAVQVTQNATPATSTTNPTASLQPTTPTTGGTTVKTAVSLVEVSQQLLDRSGPGSDITDVLLAQATVEIKSIVDTAVLSAVEAGALTGTVAGTTVPDLLTAVGSAAASLITETGTRLPPDNLLMPSPNLAYYLTRTTSAGTLYFPASPASLDATFSEGASGYSVAGAMLSYDDNLTATASDARFILGAWKRGALLVAPLAPRFAVVPEWTTATHSGPGARTLTALVQIYLYYCPVVMYPHAFAVLKGAAAAPTLS